ncbi:MAG TPA: amidohydrolase family protein, partial [Chitinophagaceae bacterium]|nr:amidohydrolase family protein [Chitinophagaceae bacterium]
GKDERLTTGNVLISNNLINKVSTEPISIELPVGTTIIDGKGKFLMPGLIDAHSHLMLESLPMQVALNADITYLTIVASVAAEKELMRGFTTIRDLAGPSFGLKRAIDEKLIKGPRIYPSGAMISQTSGHGDYYGPNDMPRQPGAPLTYLERNNVAIIADGVDQVLMRVREQLRSGATQIKLSAGGGIASPFDPLDASQYTEEELRAAVNAAENWGTYVTVHAYTSKSIQTAIKSGVKCIEHGQLVDESTAKLMADKNIWLSLQPFLDDEDVIRYPEGSANRRKQLQITEGTDNAYKLAKKYKLKLAFGTDCLFDSKLAMKQGTQLSKLSRWFTPFEILKMATSSNAELLSMSGPRNPYSAGKLGVIEEGAYADLILVDGNPLKDIKLIRDPDKNFLIIMKDGVIYKNRL